MTYLGVILGFLLLIFVLWDTVETIVLPRSVARPLRLARLYYRNTWSVWSSVGRWISPSQQRENFLSVFGPLSLLGLIIVWVICLIVGFAMIQWGLEAKGIRAQTLSEFGIELYMSGVTFFTLGYGDVTPHTPLTRTVSVVEAGVGFGLLAVVISYLPVLYQTFSRREIRILQLVIRTGSPPTAGELLYRYCQALNTEEMILLLREWEIWSAELLESYQSYPVLAFYRSQQESQSWLVALTVILDTCALVNLGFQGNPSWQKPLRWQAQLTFTMARRAIVNLARSINVVPSPLTRNRLSKEQWACLCACLASVGTPLSEGEIVEAKLSELVYQYEPYVNSLSKLLLVSLPPWFIPKYESLETD